MNQSSKAVGTPVRKTASAIGRRYDDYAHVQRRAAEDLLAYTDPCQVRRILEPGCGTGIYTELILEAFPDAAIEAVDISSSMIQRAREKLASPLIRFCVADAEELPATRCDLITSNAAFQWFRHLQRTLAQYANMLAQEGMLSFSFFGPGTYKELDDALREVTGASVTSGCFHDQMQLAAMMKTSYREWAIEKKYYTHVFPSLRELLLSIKYTSMWDETRTPREPWSPGTIARTERAYLDQHGRIEVTYEVFLCRALK